MNQKVLVIDAIYKTNKYWMVLFYIIKYTSFNRFFVVVLVFMALKKHMPMYRALHQEHAQGVYGTTFL
uniref:Uncharacterized protein n=1 Tax=Physcomitrium patens TaxID=3218 RepID=A0A2K1JED1_PHYPA|nr:hypothetical protein PHYPA_020171 [Physcomitrium patens]